AAPRAPPPSSWRALASSWRRARRPPAGRRGDGAVHDRHGNDVLAGPRGPRRPASVPTPAEHGLVVEEVQTGWVGAVVRVEKSGGMHVVVLEDRRGRTRTFPLGPGFWVDGAPVVLVAPAGPAAPRPP